MEKNLSIPVSTASAPQLCVAGRAPSPYPPTPGPHRQDSPLPGPEWPGDSGTPWAGLSSPTAAEKPGPEPTPGGGEPSW